MIMFVNKIRNILTSFQNNWWIVDVQLKMKSAIILIVTTGIPESTIYSETEGIY